MTPASIGSTAAARVWDAIVIGAGPAGSIASLELARRGHATLLVDKAAFPRSKVCGCCLNKSALAVLARLGMAGLPKSLGGSTLQTLVVASFRGRRVRVPLPGGIALSRSRLDEALVQQAVAGGVSFLPETAAIVGPCVEGLRDIQLSGQQSRARIVLVADGLAGTSLSALEGFEPRVSTRARIGIGAIIDQSSPGFEPGCISMACGQSGYVGAVHLEDGRLDIAAAIDPRKIRVAGGPEAAVSEILQRAGFDIELRGTRWHGTPPLTRRRRVQGEGLLVIGDAAGYVEPFTGEGMAWAMEGAEAAALLASEFLHGSRGIEGWATLHARIVRRAQRDCRLLAELLRRPGLADAAIGLLSAIPSLARPLVRRVQRMREAAI